MKLEGIPANVVMGATGAGKTSFILQLLAAKPAAERWAVLVNDFGRATLADAPLTSGELVVRSVAGCICCTAHVALRTALVALIRETQPRRVLVEASAAARPESILSVLGEPGIARAIKRGTAVTIIAGHQVSDPRYRENEAYASQLHAADIVLARARSDAELAAARAEIAAHGLSARRVQRMDAFRLDALNGPDV